MGSRGTAASRSTLTYIFPGQLEHNNPLVLLGVSGPGLRGTAAMSPPFQRVGAPSLGTLGTQRSAVSLAACRNQLRANRVRPAGTT